MELDETIHDIYCLVRVPEAIRILAEDAENLVQAALNYREIYMSTFNVEADVWCAQEHSAWERLLEGLSGILLFAQMLNGYPTVDDEIRVSMERKATQRLQHLQDEREKHHE